MNEANNEELDINFSELFAVLKRRWKLIVSTTLLTMIIAVLITMFLLTKQYASSARIFPQPQIIEGGGFDTNQLAASDKMVNNYMELIKGSTILDKVAINLGVQTSVVRGAINVTTQANTQIITISATTSDPALSKQIIDQTIEVFYAEIDTKFGISNVVTIDTATVATSPVSPSLKSNLTIGALLGICISCGYVFLQFMLDTHIHTKEDAEKYLGIPVLGVIPNFDK